MSRAFILLATFAGIWNSPLLAQPANVPSAFRDLYALLEGKISGFERSVDAAWPGKKPPVDFASNLDLANASRGAQLLNPQAMPGIMLELQRFDGLGTRTVTLAIPFPILHAGFHQFNGTAADFPRYVDFYKQVAAAIRNRGLSLVVKSGVMFPGFFSSGSGFNVAGYYASLNTQQYIAAKTEHAANLLTNLSPDYLNLGSEPDVEAQVTGKADIGTPAGFAGMIQQNLSQLRSLGSTGTLMGAGVGTWQTGAADYIRQLGGTNVDYIDFHIYPVNFDFLTKLTEYTDLAASFGKRTAVSEMWLLKERDSEFSTTNVALNPMIFSRDAYSFWQPLDTAFLNAVSKFAFWKRMLFISPFWTRYFFSYVDYNQVSSLQAEALINESLRLVGAAIVSGTYTSVATSYRGQATSGGSRVSTISSASGFAGNVAADSIVTLFGFNLAGSSESAGTLPLPTTLAGTTAKIVDAGGGEQPVGLVFASPNQINAVLPAVRTGPATLEISAANGAISMGALNIVSVAPGLFTANQDGKGPAAAYFTRFGAGGVTRRDLVAQCATGPGNCSTASLEISQSDTNILELYGTGIRGRQALTDVQVTIGGMPVNAVLYAGPQTQFSGLDQLNVVVPRALAGRGEVTIQLTIAGVAANPVTVRFQ